MKIFENKGQEKNVHVTILKDNMGYDQYIVPNDCSCTFVAFI